ncbi:hypothetical protein [Sphingomonas sp. LHG3443-2]|uniref:hypothetical protein n=1 Tax=Sphingomonas sp. LHG3443-2 TaxID=2804639 RepID=UPI003CEEDC71
MAAKPIITKVNDGMFGLTHLKASKVGANSMGELLVLGDLKFRSHERRQRRIAEPRHAESDAEYFERRSREEACFAAEVACDQTRLIHLELASRHAQRAAAIREASQKTA